MSAGLDKALSTAQLNGLPLRNRLLKAATFEGKSPGGVPSDDLVEFHRRLGEGGIGMTTLAYCGAEADGRVFEKMLYMHEGIHRELAALIATVKATGAAVSGQLAHCGNFSKNREFQGRRPLGPSAQFSPIGLSAGMPIAGAMSAQDMNTLVNNYATAASFMREVGFDAIEIHFGHGYALSQFISPLTNRRSDEYGGSLNNRMRLPLRVLTAVREAVGDSFPLLGKISMADGKRGGIRPADAVEVAALLDAGGIDAIIPSTGTSSMNPMLMFRGQSMAVGLLEQTQNPLARLGLRMMGSRLFREYPYQPLYLLEDAQRVRDRVQCAVAYIGGCCNAEDIDRVMTAGFDFIQLGRALIYDPDMPKNLAAKVDYRNGCSHCNRCTALIEAPGGIRCVELLPQG